MNRLSLVLLLLIEPGDIAYQYRLEEPRQLNVVILASWAIAQGCKLKPGHTVAAAASDNIASLLLAAQWPGLPSSGEILWKRGLQSAFRRGIKRGMVNLS